MKIFAQNPNTAATRAAVSHNPGGAKPESSSAEPQDTVALSAGRSLAAFSLGSVTAGAATVGTGLLLRGAIDTFPVAMTLLDQSKTLGHLAGELAGPVSLAVGLTAGAVVATRVATSKSQFSPLLSSLSVPVGVGTTVAAHMLGLDVATSAGLGGAAAVAYVAAVL
ncbi:MAG: hypothetical protein AB7S38_38860 [Vulcanimicrobiota bacterium]